MRTFVLTGALALCTSGCNGSSPATPDTPFQPVARLGSWVAAAPLPRPISDAGIVAHQGAIWVLGGRGTDESVPLSTAYRYDPTADRWDRMPDLPEAVYQPAAADLGGTLLVIGGNLSTLGLAARPGVWAWDEQAGDWVVHSALPLASSSPEAVATTRGVLVTGLGAAFAPPEDSTAFMAPGETGWAYHAPAPFPPSALTGEGVAAWAVGTISYALYDPATQVWGVPTLLPTTGFLLGTFALEGRLHLMVRLASAVDHLYLDPETGEWKSGATVPGSSQRSGAMTAVLERRAYLIGGWTPGSGATARVDVFDPS